MKLIATKDFANSPTTGITLSDAQHKGHVHRGAQFSIGTVDSYDKLPKSDPNRLLIAQLIVTGSAAIADKETVARVQAEVAAEDLRLKRDREAQPAPLTLETIVAALKALQPAATGK
jgi:hypothetical protein